MAMRQSCAFVAAFPNVGLRRGTRDRCTSAAACGLRSSRFCVRVNSPKQSSPRPEFSRSRCASPASHGVMMLVDPWSVSSQTLDVVAAQFFAASLLPYLAFLYFLERPQNETPALASFGFRFLLLFVFATIPAGIYAKTHYHDILANVDWLHGSAESLLTITNLLIAVGFRNAMRPATKKSARIPTPVPVETKINSDIFAGLAALGMAASTMGLAFAAHAEPANALSLPTWIIHVSSLIEWLVAMGLVWKYADYSGNESWKSLTWGMLPLHSSGICACTYHLFYNAPSLSLLVAIQAALTCVGNTTMAFAAYRISKSSKSDTRHVAAVAAAPSAGSNQSETTSSFVGFEDLASVQGDSNTAFLGKVLALSAVGSVAVKYGELYVDGVFHPTPSAALAIILIPSALNVVKWWRKN